MSPRSCYASHISGNIERKQRTQMAQWVKNLPAMQKTQETWVSIPGLGRSPGEHGTQLQYSCLENCMDRGAWWATVHGAAQSRTQLSDLAHTQN